MPRPRPARRPSSTPKPGGETARPPSSRSRDEAKLDTRVALLRAGMDLFREQGLDAPSLDAICERAGFTRGAFYVHFRDRDDFLVAVMEHVGEAYLDAVLTDEGGGEDLAETARRFVATTLSGDYPLTGKGGIRPHQLLDACARSEAIRARYVALVDETRRRVARAVGEGQRARTLRDDIDAEQVASLLLSAVVGAQSLLELGLPLDLGTSALAVLTLLSPSPPAPPPPAAPEGSPPPPARPGRRRARP